MGKAEHRNDGSLKMEDCTVKKIAPQLKSAPTSPLNAGKENA
jgi:hypothetical protein